MYGTYFPAGIDDMPSFFGAAAPSNGPRGIFMTDGEPDLGLQPPRPGRACGCGSGTPGATGINIDLANTTYTDMVHNVPGTTSAVVLGGDATTMVGLIRSAIFTGVLAMNVAHVLLCQY
ncbi:hypothetical protein [Xylella fastidiosa]|uniref:hypothetical protein n=1 Tax=Xylella fastidiosa TaxID=2371 RepID=UPI003AFAF547